MSCIRKEGGPQDFRFVSISISTNGRKSRAHSEKNREKFSRGNVDKKKSLLDFAQIQIGDKRMLSNLFLTNSTLDTLL